MAKPDIDKALVHAAQIPDKQSNRQWIYGAAWEIANDDPAKAASIAEALPLSGSRKRSVAAHWLTKDDETATQWIEESSNFDTKANLQGAVSQSASQ